MPRLKIPKNRKIIFSFLLILFVGFFLRVFLARYFVKESGDLRLYADWAEKFWPYGSKDFYTYALWYYAPPNYPPLLSLIYAGAYWLYEHKYYLAQLHNFIKIPPAFFIVYFYEHGLYLLLKLPGILADIGLGVLIFQLVKKLTGQLKKAYLACAFYILNPVSIFLSGVWGQTDSLVSFFGLTAFITLWLGKAWLSIPLLFLSFYIKPNWGIFVPLYIFLFILKKPQIKQILLGFTISVVLFFVITLPFAKGNVFSFSKWLWSERLLPTATVAHKASVSAFNFHSIFLTIDKHLDYSPYLGIPANLFGIILFILVNVLAFRFIKRQKVSLSSVLVGIFSVGFGGYLFLTNMLERYFFQSFVPMIILMFTSPGLLFYGVLINIAVFANLFYSFFRRSWGALADVFGAYNFLIVRLFSLLNLASWVFLLRRMNFLKK
ncbi:hypothetical protein A2V56_00820 [Candidatus Woesebacteria bacterium RBG_19FT_COMBO_42_9]|uniref:Glycosyltransferase RgtA/B/C/D-like domain-containing protein n=1 Tax=Candidatus Woesebacteria bacterium RBG_16_42_24 TaxID=1802485 RepID=A0A1F7XKJ8_9BACT|nr:MAG: hypothetical protein A2V97_02475 [Candidatus Woesebacteria bacterium RBG_16_42_24]OGM17708.1 MAG: hypothetical protein A2V56_00820 [Candidatus Woesebacteria bacterium RBG_19FT_COMBO_42_9]OGM68351.1 MAG: hypothetical protein A2985_02335 [Candidatus Woesebacteria bacterium RIFCSPLOWO2_01_FULL_43_11]